MDKTKRRRVIFQIINFVLMVGVFAAMFAISISAGIAALVFSALGGFFGFTCRTARIHKAFLDKIAEHKDALMSGKTLVLDASGDSVTVSIREPKAKRYKTKK